jgi:hypothetical protein
MVSPHNEAGMPSLLFDYKHSYTGLPGKWRRLGTIRLKIQTNP